MVMTPQKPRAPEAVDSRQWTWMAFAFVVVLLGMGIALAVIIATPDTGPGPQGPLGPQEELGPQGDDVLEGSGIIVTDIRAVGTFDRVVLTGVADVIVTTDGAADLEIEADDNIVPLIETTVVEGILTIALEPPDSELRPTGDVIVRVATAELKHITHRGVGSVTVGELDTDLVGIEFTGVGGVDISNLTAERLVVEASGMGAVTVAGEVTEQTATLGGTVDYEAERLESETATVIRSGGGSAMLWVEGDLKVTIRDLGSVSYYGTPVVTSDISDLGTLTPLGER